MRGRTATAMRIDDPPRPALQRLKERRSATASRRLERRRRRLSQPALCRLAARHPPHLSARVQGAAVRPSLRTVGARSAHGHSPSSATCWRSTAQVRRRRLSTAGAGFTHTPPISISTTCLSTTIITRRRGRCARDPSPKRIQAMFDWWERMFDYAAVREEVRRDSGRHVWRLFDEACDKLPADPGILLRHMGADSRHWPLDCASSRASMLRSIAVDQRRSAKTSAGRCAPGAPICGCARLLQLFAAEGHHHGAPGSLGLRRSRRAGPARPDRQRQPARLSCATAASVTASRAVTRRCGASTTDCATRPRRARLPISVTATAWRCPGLDSSPPTRAISATCCCWMSRPASASGQPHRGGDHRGADLHPPRPAGAGAGLDRQRAPSPGCGIASSPPSTSGRPASGASSTRRTGSNGPSWRRRDEVEAFRFLETRLESARRSPSPSPAASLVAGRAAADHAACRARCSSAKPRDRAAADPARRPRPARHTGARRAAVLAGAPPAAAPGTVTSRAARRARPHRCRCGCKPRSGWA